MAKKAAPKTSPDAPKRTDVPKCKCVEPRIAPIESMASVVIGYQCKSCGKYEPLVRKTPPKPCQFCSGKTGHFSNCKLAGQQVAAS